MSSQNRSRTTDRVFVSPDAPAGGGGPGHFHQSASTIHCHGHASMPAHGSPAARRMTPQDHQRANTLRRAKCVYDALCKAQSRVGPAIKEETGCALDEALSGILPAVVMMVGVMAGSAALGGVAGAAIGFFAGGVGAIPGAAAGAATGAELSMLLLNALGIGFLAVYIVQHIAKVFDLATQGVKEAWDAPASPIPTSAKIDHASRSLARAVAVFIRLILEGIVLYLLEKGTAVTARRVSAVGAKLRASKLGVRLAEYVERNWKALVENPKLRRRAEGATSSSRERTRDAGFASSNSQSEAISSVAKNEGQLTGDRKFRLGKQLTPAEVKEFYKQTGWSDARIDAHMEGIDFSKPVTIEIIPKCTKVDQWVDPIRGGGNYFAPPGTPANELGIYQGERVLTSFESAKDVTVLRSTATDIIDTWSVPGQKIATKGGGTQYFSINPADFIKL